jgi:hypothetical protein
MSMMCGEVASSPLSVAGRGFSTTLTGDLRCARSLAGVCQCAYQLHAANSNNAGHIRPFGQMCLKWQLAAQHDQ